MTPETLDLLTLVVVTFAAYRLTRFIVLDSLLGRVPTEGDRGSGFRRKLDHFAYADDGTDRSWWRGKLGDLLTCSWCIGFWVAALTLWGWVDGPEWLRWIIVAFAVAGAQGFIASRYEA